MQTTALFWDRLADRYARSPIRNIDAYEATLDRVRANLSPRMNVLELGAGTGTTALRLADAAGRYTATDYSAAMVAIGREKARDAEADNLGFVTAAVDDPAVKGPYDAVLAFNLMHLLPDLEGDLAAIAAKLPKGGLFISKTPCLAERQAYLKLIIPVIQWIGKAPFVRFLKTAELDGLIEAAGFRIIETGNYPVNPPNHFVVAEKI